MTLLNFLINMKLRIPLEQVKVNQPFGVNFVNFYTNMGMKGHNGIDFSAKDSTNVYASHDGNVTWAGMDGDGGISVTLTNEIEHYKTIYYHLKEVKCNIGDNVSSGQLVGLSDNTGSMTTGSHLHFGLKLLDNQNFNSLNYNNGYFGAINPAPYFTMAYNGFQIGAKDYDKSRCYQRYYRETKRNVANEMKVALYMAKRLKRLPNNEEINAAIWGGWDIESIINPSMYSIWSQLKKDEYLNRKRVDVMGM